MTKPVVSYNEPENLDKVRLIDAYASSVAELFGVRNPQWKKGKPGFEEAQKEFIKTVAVAPVWVSYESQHICVKTVEESVYYELLTARNKYAISTEEQVAYRNLHTGIIGLSIGSGVVHSFVMTGGPKKQKISDFDTIEVTNLNRMRAQLFDVGTNKTDVAARNAWAVDPFLELELWDSGVTTESLERFILAPKLDVFIDEMDSLDLKVRSRLICKKHGIPVVMATDNGDGIILDIERFDVEPNRPIFHGMIREPKPEDLDGLDYRGWLKMATEIVGADYLTERMQESLLEIGKSIASVPQLGTTASTAAAGIAFACRRIAAKLPLHSGRYVIGFEQLLIPEYTTEEQLAHRKQQTEIFKQTFASKFQ